MDRAVIFDVDGVLLDLTAPEESAFFRAESVQVGCRFFNDSRLGRDQIGAA